MLSTFAIFLVLIVVGYFIYISFPFQTFLYKKKLQKTLKVGLSAAVKGEFIQDGYFAVSHKFVTPIEHKTYFQRHRASFSKCYNVLRFKTPDAHWEIFFHLVKDGSVFSEQMSLRVFPIKKRIKSEGNIEKNYSRLNIFTNNRYLTQVLENSETKDYLKWLIRHNEDILLISHNNLHFKAFIDTRKLSVKRTLDMIKAMNVVKSKIYRDDVIEY
jgi:hypothetical protein